MPRKTVTATYTRMANTTQYAADDAVSDGTVSPTVLTFAGVVPRMGAGGSVYDAVCISSALQTDLPQFELYLFDAAPTAINDNAAFGLTDAQALTYLGMARFTTFYDLDPTSGTNGNAVSTAVLDQPIGFDCATGATDIYGLVKVTNTYTPVSAEALTFRLKVDHE